jgi:glycosyltransferase involved in cell wall biosynthesis
MGGLSDLGARVGLATASAPLPEATAGLALERLVDLSSETRKSSGTTLSWIEERFRSYWGIPRERIGALAVAADDFRADVVVVSGLDVLPMLGGVRKGVRVWYAGDEWTWHHLSQVRGLDQRSRENLRDAFIKGIYERAFKARVDRAWVVSDVDGRSLRRVAGVRAIDTLPNGVDTDSYQPVEAPQDPDSAIFWGRLDFGPNIQALEWFLGEVWPLIHADRPAARFTIVGFRPEAAVRRLVDAPGVVLEPNVPDIRPLVARHAIVALPFVSGGGIKNKLLEAASMGKAIVATSRTLLGLKGIAPIRIASAPQDWARAMTGLWDDEAMRRTLGAQARQWVTTEHTWAAAAERALAGLEQSLAASGARG